jgi:hypothetical protein
MSKSTTSKSTTTNYGVSQTPDANSLPDPVNANRNGLPEPRPMKIIHPNDREMEVLS